MNDWGVTIESLRLTDGVVQGWGRLSGKGERPSVACMEIRSPAGEVVDRIFATLSIAAGAAAKNSDQTVNIYGQLKAEMPVGAECYLVLEWPDAGPRQYPIPCPRNVTGRKGVGRVFSLPWSHYLARAWRLVRTGQVWLLFSKGMALMRVACSVGMAPEKFFRDLASTGTPLALVIDHDLGGGANLYRDRLVSGLASQGVQPILLTVQQNMLATQLSADVNGRRRYSYPASVDELFAALATTRIQTVYLNNVIAFQRPLELIQNLAGWLSESTVRPEFVFLLHDYYCMCPSWLLLDKRGEYCGVPEVSQCDHCLPHITAPLVQLAGCTDIRDWREKWFGLLSAADEVRCFSNLSRELIQRAYPAIAPGRVTVVPHKLEPEAFPAIEVKDGGHPVVAVIGHIAYHKGSEVVRQLALEIAATDSPVRLVIVGTIDRDLPESVVTVTGPYRHDELPGILKQHGVNVGFMPSIWPETFSYTTEEMMVMGLPLLVFDLGAPGERVSRYERGLVIRSEGPGAVLDGLQRLYAEHVRQ